MGTGINYGFDISKVTHIGAYAFADCPNLNIDSDFVFDTEEAISIGDYAFRGAQAYNIKFNKVSYLGIGAFMNSSVSEIVFGTESTFTSIPDYCFAFQTTDDDGNTTYSGGSSLNIVMLDSITKIGIYAFAGRNSIQNATYNAETESCDCDYDYFTIGAQITEVGEGAFLNNFTMKIVLTSVQTVVYQSAFRGSMGGTVYCKFTEADLSAAGIDTSIWFKGDDTNYESYVYFYSETEPTESGKFWHMDENNCIAEW